MSQKTYVDLFCGAGGFSLGFDNKGFKNIFSLDCEKSFCETYMFNFPKHNLLYKKIEDLKKNEINKITNGKKVDVVIGGPPCQGFSIAGNIGRKFIDDPRNYLFREFVRIINIIKPNIIIMENVERLYSHNKHKTKNQIIKLFEKTGYYVECKVLNSSDFLIPQIRKRTIFIGNLLSKKIIFPEKVSSKLVSVKEAIGDLPQLKPGEKSSLPNHVAMNHTDQMLKKMSYVKDGGGRETIPKFLRPRTGDIRKYIKYSSNKPSVCVTGDMRKIFHYSQNRALTVRELARIQTFPDNFIFKGSTISQQQQIGNAVPPKLSEYIAEAVSQMLKNDIKKAS